MSSDEPKNVVVMGVAASAKAIALPPKISVTMPLAKMVRGYVLAHRRLEEVVGAYASIPLFEIGHWLVSISDRKDIVEEFRKDADVRALRFLRNRIHHHYAAAVFIDPDTQEWRWYRAEVLPEPAREEYSEDERGQRAYEQHLDRKGEGFYRRQLEEQPMLDVFRRLEPLVIALAPDADLT
jgi:hypothetical protein